MTVTLRLTTQVQASFRRMTAELTALQGQVASGAKAQDLNGFGEASTRILTAKNLKASIDARESVVSQLDARFGVQSAALAQVADASTQLAQALREAVSANDGRGIATELGLSFDSVVSALNQTWNGQPLFAGERQDVQPIRVRTLAELQAAATPADLFDEAQRRQTIDVGQGAPIEAAAKASELSQGLFDALRDLKNLLDASGGSIGQPINGAQSSQLLSIVQRLEAQSNTLITEEGRTGQVQKRLAEESLRLRGRSDLLVKEIGDQADADLAEVSIRLSSLTMQYQAAAKSFADLSKLSLLNYL